MTGEDRKTSRIWMSIAGLSIAIVAVMVWALSADEDLSNKEVSEQQQTTIPATPGSAIKTQLKNKPKEQDELETELLTQELREELDWVAKIYEEQAKYPITSRLVTDPELARSPAPYEEAQVDMQLPDEDGKLSPIRLSAAVDRIRYFDGEPISIRLQLFGTQGNEAIAVAANIKQSDNTALLPSDIELSDVSGKQTTFIGTVDSSLFSIASQASELLAVVSVQIDADNYITTVPFMFGQASARLDNVALSRPDGAFLTIPLEYSVSQAGYYFVSAVLDDAASGRPLVRLETEGPMNQGNDVLLLQAHHQALKDAGSPGPYQLRVMRSFRGALPGEGNDVATAISQTAYAIPGFAFDQYENIPYSDTGVEERLEALRGLSGGSG